MTLYNPSAAAGAIRVGAVQDVPYNAKGGKNAVSEPFPEGTEAIEVAVHCRGSGVRYAIGENPDVSTDGSHALFPGSGTWLRVAHAGERLAAISDDDHTGFVNITIAQSQRQRLALAQSLG